MKVVIVGAGAAGLAAAHSLLQNGVQDLVVLESSDHIGGRVHSLDWAGTSIELGAQWIHGVEGNVACDIALERGLLDDPNGPTLEDIGEDFYDENGNHWDEHVIESIEELFEAADEALEGKVVDHTETLQSYFEPTLASMVARKKQPFRRKVAIYQDFYHRYQQAVEGCDHWGIASLWGSHRQYQLPPGTESVTIKADHQMSDLLDHFLSTDVKTKILTRTRMVQIKAVSEGSGYVVHSECGREFEADLVLVTVSLGVLKHHAQSWFVPPLPDWKMRAIDAIEFGTVDKIYLEFDQPWWTSDMEGFGFLFNEDCDYTEREAKKDWTRFLVGLYLVAHRPNVLSLWISGQGARHLETLEDGQACADTMRFIRQALSSDYPDIPEPIQFLVTRWHLNPHVLGSYSFLSPRTLGMDVFPDQLARPVGKILFAGEATSSHHFSTLHGAIESGLREAQGIIDAHKLS